MIFHNNHIWNLSDIYEWFWCVLSGDENEKIIFYKGHIWHLFDLHEWFSYGLSDYQLEYMIFYNIHMWNLCDLLELFFMNPKRRSPVNDFSQIFVTFMNGFDMTSQVWQKSKWFSTIVTFEFFVAFTKGFDKSHIWKLFLMFLHALSLYLLQT